MKRPGSTHYLNIQEVCFSMGMRNVREGYQPWGLPDGIYFSQEVEINENHNPKIRLKDRLFKNDISVAEIQERANKELFSLGYPMLQKTIGQKESNVFYLDLVVWRMKNGVCTKHHHYEVAGKWHFSIDPFDGTDILRAICGDIIREENGGYILDGECSDIRFPLERLLREHWDRKQGKVA